MKKTLIKNGSIITEKEVKKADVLIGIDGVIENVQDVIVAKDVEVIDVAGCLLFPLLIDCHVHFREPGLTHKATMESESVAALAGGVGAVCEMPNTIPPTVSIEALREKVKIASHVDHVKIKFFFGITEPKHLEELVELWTSKDVETEMLKLHCAGVKLFLDHSTGDQKIEEKMLDAVFSTCAELKIPIVSHCEDPKMNEEAVKKNPNGDVSLHSVRRPAASEVKAIGDAIALVKKHGAAFHVAHLSTKGGLDLVRKAKKEGLPVTCEVAPHHLFLTVEDYETLGTLGKMNPPLRSMEDRNALWKGIGEGTVDCISTDHAPHTLEEKNAKNPLEAPSGVPGVETMLPLLFSVASGHWPHPSSPKPAAQFSYEDIVRVCSVNPAKIFGLKRDTIEKGKRARFVKIDPKKETMIERKNLKTKCGWSAYEGWRVYGGIPHPVL